MSNSFFKSNLSVSYIENILFIYEIPVKDYFFHLQFINLCYKLKYKSEVFDLKKFLAVFLSFLLLLSFTSCSKTDGENAEGSNAESSEISDASKDTENSEVSDVPEVPEKTLFGTDLGDGVISADYLSVSDRKCTDVLIYKDFVISAYTDNLNTNAEAKLFNKYTGKEIRNFDISELYWPRIKINEKGQILFYDTFGSYYLFDSTESETAQKDIIPQPEIGQDPEAGPFYFIVDNFSRFIADEGNIKYQEIGKEPVEVIDLSDKFNIIDFKYEDSERYYFAANLVENNNTITFYLTKKDFTYSNYDYSSIGKVFLDGDNKIIYNFDGTVEIQNSKNEFVKKEFTLDDSGDNIANCAFDRLFTFDLDSDKDNLILKTYDYNGNINFKKAIDVNGWERKFFTESEKSDENVILIFEVSDADYSNTKNIVYFVKPQESKENLRQTALNAAEKAFEIEKKYGIEIYAGKSVTTKFLSYKTDICEDDTKIFKALSKIEYVLDKFPEGFIKELFSGSGNEYQNNSCTIYLTGSIYPDGEDAISSAAAFTYTEDKKRKIVVDATLEYEMDVTLAHELMHCIDEYIMLLPYEEGKDNGFEHWNDYLPENFDYAYRYLNDDGSEYYDTKYTIYDDEHEKYFVDAYSKTFPTEDRSRLFENLFREDGFQEKHPKILARAEYMCKVIRDSFESLKGAENIWWEREFEDEPAEAA